MAIIHKYYTKIPTDKKDNAFSWCGENLIVGEWACWSGVSGFYFTFRNEKDLTIFTLKWL